MPLIIGGAVLLVFSLVAGAGKTAPKQLPPASKVPQLPGGNTAQETTELQDMGDAYDAALAAALANGDTVTLEALAKQADAAGFSDIARSIRAEIARLTGAAPKSTATTPSNPKPVSKPLFVPVPYFLTIGSTDANSTGFGDNPVSAWQDNMNSYGIGKVPVTGIYDAATSLYTSAWQKKMGLPITGNVAQADWNKAGFGQLTPEGVKVAAFKAQNNVQPNPIVLPTVTVTPGPVQTGSQPTLRQGMTDAQTVGKKVSQWQSIIGVSVDGIFGPQTASATKVWQSGHGLSADGIVGPQTWAASLGGGTPAQAPIVTPIVTPQVPPTIQQGSTGPTVTKWQLTAGISPADGIFGPGTKKATQAWQSGHGLSADGIVGPATWGAAGVVSGTFESKAREAARKLTDYLKSLTRGKENKSVVQGFLSDMGMNTSQGLYDRNAARACMVQGFVPQAPFYWPKRNPSAKAEFLKLVEQYQHADPRRAREWASLIHKVNHG